MEKTRILAGRLHGLRRTAWLVVCLMLSMMLLVGMIPAAAFADEAEQVSDAAEKETPKNGWVDESDGTRYYVDGVARTGWMPLDGYWYYFHDNGLLSKDEWIPDGGYWYYTFGTTGAMATGWVLWEGDWYYLRSGGNMAVGWVSDGGYWYYMNYDGSMASGWVWDGAWYYMDTRDGHMSVGWVYDGSWWFMGGSGIWVSDVAGGGPPHNTFVEVNISTQMVYLVIDGYTYYETPCVTGMRNSMDTPTGTYYLESKVSPAVLRGPGYVSPVTYWMGVVGGVGLHDATWQPWFGGNRYTYAGSHGCINLPYNAASWLYGKVWVGIPVIMHY